MHTPFSPASARLLRSTDHLDLSVPRVWTALVQCRAFALTSPFTWNGFPPVVYYELNLCLAFPPYPLALLKRFPFHRGSNSTLKTHLNSMRWQKHSIGLHV